MLGHGQAQSTASLGVRVTRAGRNGGGPVPDPTRKSIAGLLVFVVGIVTAVAGLALYDHRLALVAGGVILALFGAAGMERR